MGADEENISRAFCRKRGLDPDTMVNVDGNGTMLPLWQVWTSDAALDAVSEAGKKVGWAEAERVACLDDVDEALREFATDPTGDNGTMIIREVMRALRAQPAVQGGGEVVDYNYRAIAHLIGSIYFAGDFKAETANERTLESLLKMVGTRYSSWAEVEAGYEKLSTPPESGGQGEAVAEVCRPGHPRPDSATFVRLLHDNLPDGTKLYTHPPAQASGAVAVDVLAEVAKATRKFPTWPTDPLHALAVLGEEFGELTKAVLQTVYEPHKVKAGEVRMEAVQTAAMALRFLASLERYRFVGSLQHRQQPIGGAAPCWCLTCHPNTLADQRMALCPTCGNKRCPRANDHRHACTGSNEPGQPGSAYPAALPFEPTPPAL